MATRRSLSIYRIKESIDDQVIADFDDIIQLSDTIKTYTLPADAGLDAQLYVDQPAVSEPAWLNFLEEGFGEIEEIDKSITYRAVLLIRIDPDSPKYFAIPFGAGRFLLQPGSVVHDYGLKVALNSIYAHLPGQPLDPSRIRSLDIKTVAANTLHTRRQSNRRTNFEVFGIDTDRDMLKRITGLPLDEDFWGTRVTGADAVQVNPMISFADLGSILEEVEETYTQTIYREYFSWVDNVRAVADVAKRQQLQDSLIELLKNRDIDRLEMAPPELVDWDQIAVFRFHPWLEEEFTSLSLSSFLQLLDDEGRLADLTLARLKTYRVIAENQQGIELNRWNAFNCIAGEFKVQADSYLLEDGEFYGISPDFLEDLDAFVETIPSSPLDLFVPATAMTEGEYNIEASRPTDKLCLDKKTVRLDNRTTAIEICDILTDAGHYIHVKRKLSSSSLSHLFNQGYVSGELLWASQDYRDAVTAKIEEAEQEQFHDFNSRFQRAMPIPFSTLGLEIVYCVIAKWDNRSLSDAIPFFSKINLRRVVEDLIGYGYKVSFKKINVPGE